MKLEELVSGLKDRIGSTNLSDRTISEYAGRALSQLGEGDADDKFWEFHVGNLKTMSGNLSKDISEQLAKEKEAKLKEWKEAFDKTHQTQHEGEEDTLGTEIAKMRKELDELRKESAERSTREKRRLMLEDVIAKSDELNVANKEIWDDAVSAVTVDEGDDQANVLDKVKSSYEAKVKRYLGEGARPYRTSQQTHSDDTKKELDSFFSRMATKGAFPKQD